MNVTPADLAQYGAPAVSGAFALAIGWWQNRRKKAEDQAEKDAAELRTAHRAEVDARIKAASDRAEDAHHRLDAAQRDWMDGHHRVRKDVTEGLIEAYERLRVVENDLAVVKDRSARAEETK